MNLEQYVTDLCAKLRSNEEVKLDASVMPYRHLIASVLQSHLTGPASTVVEGLLGQVCQLQISRDELYQQHLNYKAVNEKAKRIIQSVPKVRKIAKKNKDAV